MMFGEASIVVDSDGSTTSRMIVDSGDGGRLQSKFWADRRKCPRSTLAQSKSQGASSEEETPAAKCNCCQKRKRSASDDRPICRPFQSKGRAYESQACRVGEKLRKN